MPITELDPKLQAEYRQKAQALQMLPGVAVQALEIARDPECTIRDFVAVVERDTKLAADILAMSNSVMFSAGRPAALSLQQAIVRLGFRQCRNLILGTSMASLMKNVSLEQEWVRDVLCRHSFLTGMLAMNVNKIVGTGFQGEEFAAGLVHDFGRLLLAVVAQDKFCAADPLHFDESPEILTSERRILGTDHCEVGTWYAELSKLPSEFVEVIRYHHNPAACTKHHQLVALVAIADHMANYLQRFENGNEYNLGENEAVYVLESCGQTNVATRLADVCREMMTSAKKDVQKMWSV
jgi:HD-like signal output (HDOD) protein